MRTVAASADVVRCSHGLQVVPDVELGRRSASSTCSCFPAATRGRCRRTRAFLERMRDLAEAGTLMTSVCTGALVYGKAGTPRRPPATTHWGALDRLAELGADVDRDARFVDDGDVVTAAGVSAGIDMALHLVARLESVERAQEVRRYIQYDPQPPV